ncbi:hypothetical protein [Nocardia sp. NPDC050793]|uniref:hypothetical protein n=1 Tax=Nocardia sp. NPDC050793 TaxID=3155159 RepID=UPI0033E0B8A1
MSDQPTEPSEFMSLDEYLAGTGSDDRLTDDQLRELVQFAAPDLCGRLADELLDARGEIAALRTDLEAKRSDFDAALHRLSQARARIAELEPQQPYRAVWSDELPPGGMVCNICRQPVETEPCAEHAPPGYVVGWQESDGRVYIALDEAEATFGEPDRYACADLGDARMFLAEIAPEDPDTTFHVYELREVSTGG